MTYSSGGETMSMGGRPAVALTPQTIARRRRFTRCLKFHEASTSCRDNVAAATWTASLYIVRVNAPASRYLSASVHISAVTGIVWNPASKDSICARSCKSAVWRNSSTPNSDVEHS